MHNPCFSCHTKSQRPNFLNDDDLQQSYSFAEPARVNPWTNLFLDRTDAVAAISDDAIDEYIKVDNYLSESGDIILTKKLTQLPEQWDAKGDGQWDGFIPDAYFKFDAEGFDRNPDNEYTGWRAFAYYPFLGTFWPTNGSTDDVLIRLPEAFRTDTNGHQNYEIYKVNLAIVEAMLKEQDVAVSPVDERMLGNVDIDKNGTLGIADKVAYNWAPVKGEYMWYVGQANRLQREKKLHMAAGLYPEGTEFLHSVRYIDVDDDGNNQLSARMKELRYAVKRGWVNYSQLRAKVDTEFKEKDDFPNRIRSILGNAEDGVSNGQGWVYAGFIEDA
ncbi:MAG: hypothetical protein MI754_19500, partial [Chromatiales bacterium]|nr:hypothetical protein [Chromatiales bacterium]